MTRNWDTVTLPGLWGHTQDSDTAFSWNSDTETAASKTRVQPSSQLDNNFTPSHDSNGAQLSNSTPNLDILTFVYIWINCLPNLLFLDVLNRNKYWWVFEDCPGQMIGKTFFNFVEMLLFIRPTGLAILRNAGGPMRIDLIVLWLGEDYISPPAEAARSSASQSWPEPEMSSPSYAGAEEEWEEPRCQLRHDNTDASDAMCNDILTSAK